VNNHSETLNTEIDDYLERVRSGLVDANAGRVIDQDRVCEWLSTWGTAHETQPPVYTNSSASSQLRRRAMTEL